MEERKIIAVFGGSFNPPLISHFSLAEQILTKYRKVEKIIFVPVSQKYNKKGLIEDDHRYNMLKIGCNANPKMEVLDIELNRENQAFTIDTLELIKQKYPDRDIYFIIGTDNLKELETWHRAKELVKKYKFFILERDEDVFEDIIEKDVFLRENRESFVNLKNIKKIFLSSTLVREKLKKGESVEGLIPQEIANYIKKNHLYRWGELWKIELIK